MPCKDVFKQKIVLYRSKLAIISEDFGNGAGNRTTRGGRWRCGLRCAINICKHYHDFICCYVYQITSALKAFPCKWTGISALVQLIILDRIGCCSQNYNLLVITLLGNDHFDTSVNRSWLDRWLFPKVTIYSLSPCWAMIILILGAHFPEKDECLSQHG